MISNLDPASEMFLADLGRVQNSIADANRQVSSGKRVTTPADAPADLQTLLELRADQMHNTQIQSNLTIAKTDAQAADGAVGAAIKLMDRALVLAAQGANNLQTAATRSSLAQEIEALQQQMVATSQTVVQGRYIFSGDSDTGPAYTYDPSTPGVVTEVSAAPATRRIQDAAGGSFTASLTANDIFDTRNADGTPAANNVFAALEGLRQALLTNDDAAVTGSVDGLKQAADHLNSTQAFYGAVENRIDTALDFASSYDIRLQTDIGQIEDADIPAAALELSQSTTQLQAALQMRAHMPHTSLFDFLG
jgi:flagellar hook-associated protein 3 FlgL